VNGVVFAQPGVQPMYYAQPGMAMSPMYYPQAVPYPAYGMSPQYVMPMAQQVMPQGMPPQLVPQGGAMMQQQVPQSTHAVNQAAPVSRQAVTQVPAVETLGPVVRKTSSTASTSSTAAVLQQSAQVKSTQVKSEALRPPVEVESDEAPPDPMFNNLDTILGHVKRSDEWDVLHGLASPSPGPDAAVPQDLEGPASVALALSKDPLAQSSTSVANAQLASLNEVMGDLNQANRDITQPKAARAQDDFVSSASLMETKGSHSKQQRKLDDISVAVGTGGMMRRIKE